MQTKSYLIMLRQFVQGKPSYSDSRQIGEPLTKTTHSIVLVKSEIHNIAQMDLLSRLQHNGLGPNSTIRKLLAPRTDHALNLFPIILLDNNLLRRQPLDILVPIMSTDPSPSAQVLSNLQSAREAGADVSS